jgi:hypothetical protein
MATINNLNSVTTPSGSDLMALYSAVDGDSRKISIANLATFLQTLVTFTASMVTQYSAPLTGATVTITDNKENVRLIITPAGTIANLTLTMPVVTNTLDGQELLVSCTQIVSTLTITAPTGGAVVGAPSALTANGFFRLRYDAVLSTWYRVG